MRLTEVSTAVYSCWPGISAAGFFRHKVNVKLKALRFIFSHTFQLIRMKSDVC